MRLRALVVVAATATLLAAGLTTAPVEAAGLTAAPNAVAERVGGADRYLTAIEISKKLGPGANYVLLASGENFPDALAAASASFLDGNAYAPILLTPKNELTAAVRDEIDRRLDPGNDVWLLGGPAALSTSIDAALTQGGYHPRRLTSTLTPGSPPADRYDTAAAVAEQFGEGGQLSEIIIATGLRFPDALAVSAYSAAKGVPILLGGPAGVPRATQAYLDKHAGAGTTVFVIGGQQAVDAPTEPAGITVDRIAGSDRFGTAREVARELLGATAATTQPNDVLVLARADDPGGFADALAGGPLAAAAEGPLVLTNPAELPATTANYVGNLGYDQPLRPAKSFVLGLAGAVNDTVVTAWTEILEGIRATPGRTSTRRNTASAGTVTSTEVDARGCNDGNNHKARSFTYKDVKVEGDTPGTATFTGVVACDVASGEAATILPSGTVAFTPSAGGAAVAGVILGGHMGRLVRTESGGSPLPLPIPLPLPGGGGEVTVTRPVSISFALPGIGAVGHLSFVDNGGVSQGLLALVTGAGAVPVTGSFASFPSSGCATASFTGSLGETPFTMANLNACRIEATSDVWRIGTGSVGGLFEGDVVGGARRGDVIYLALRTALGLVDMLLKVDSTIATVPAESAAFVQPLPDQDASVSFTATAPGAESSGCDSLRAGRDLNSGAVETPFGGTLNVTDLRECRTDAGVGVVAAVVGAANPANRTTRPVCYARDVECAFRGRILGGMFTEAAPDRSIGLTLLIEENRRNNQNTADVAGLTLTVVRLITTVPAGAAGTTPGRGVTFAR
jgi:putative cell wall-binding protein